MFMGKTYAGLALFLVAACAAGGQEPASGNVQSNVREMHQSVTANRGPEVDTANKTERLPGTATGESAGSGSQQTGRFQLSEGVDAIRFRSHLFTANTLGIKTSGAYALNDHLGVECAVAADFGHEIYDREHVKLLIVDCGPRIVLETGKIAPWVHTLGGWSHLLPQTAGNSQSAFSIVAGGGVDFRVRGSFSLRVEANYVRSTFFRGSQNNIQVGLRFVYHF